jgi:hypothetical protein
MSAPDWLLLRAGRAAGDFLFARERDSSRLARRRCRLRERLPSSRIRVDRNRGEPITEASAPLRDQTL